MGHLLSFIAVCLQRMQLRRLLVITRLKKLPKAHSSATMSTSLCKSQNLPHVALHAELYYPAKCRNSAVSRTAITKVSFDMASWQTSRLLDCKQHSFVQRTTTTLHAYRE